MKYFWVVLATALTVFLGAYIYFKGLGQNKFASTISEVTPSPNTFATTVPTMIPEKSPTSGNMVTAGGILLFKTYSLELPVGWTHSTDGSTMGEIDKLTLTHGAYKIVFTQAAMGGGGCTYPGDPDQPMSQKFNAFSEVTAATGEKLRVSLLPSGNRVVCELQSGSWSDLTGFGHIDITNPSTPEQSILDQINLILSSLKQI